MYTNIDVARYIVILLYTCIFILRHVISFVLLGFSTYTYTVVYRYHAYHASKSSSRLKINKSWRWHGWLYGVDVVRTWLEIAIL